VTRRVLVAGETSVTYHVHHKGITTYGEASHAVELGRFLEALEAGGWEVTHVPNHTATRDFPASAEALAPYDVVVLSDITSDTLLLHRDTTVHGQRTPDRLRLLADHARDGHGLLMIGGYMSFSGIEGKARYHATRLRDVLPVEMLGVDDRMEEVEGVTPRVVDGDHPVLDGIPADWPHFLGYNRLRPREGGRVLMTIGEDDDPFLVVGTHGAGRVAAVASDCAPHWGSPEFLAWDTYDRFWNNLLGWLAGDR
jgi:uncharacterized membrane protein